MVYHKHNARTHCFRVAKGDGSDEPPENGEGVWYRSALIGWNNWPGEDEGYPLFYDLVDNWSGGIGPKWTDDNFGDNLSKAQGSMVSSYTFYFPVANQVRFRANNQSSPSLTLTPTAKCSSEGVCRKSKDFQFVKPGLTSVDLYEWTRIEGIAAFMNCQYIARQSYINNSLVENILGSRN